MHHIAIVGAGQAGAALAAKLRTLGHRGRITLIGEEPAAPYQRPPLSKKYMLGELPLERLMLRPEAYYAEQGIDLLTGIRVGAIDPAARTLKLSDGRQLEYDRLALTTGAVPIRLPAALGGELDGVYCLRNLADADHIGPEIRPGRRVLIVGGGYIGLEAAAVAAQRGLAVTLVEQAPRILARVASAETADYFRTLHRAHGVDLREGAGLARLEGAAGRVTRAVLSDDSAIAVDFVIVGIGVRPDTALAEAAGLVLDNGIAVDAAGRSSAPGIFAAGDCASFPWRGGRIRLESVPNAIDQAEAVAAAMLDQPVTYEARPWFWSDQYDVKLQIAGLNTGHDRVVIREDGRGRSHWYFRGDRLLAVDAMNDARGYMAGKRLIEGGLPVTPAEIADPGTDLAALLRRTASPPAPAVA
ncbi:NAD(P)/FAD-dependent oxidoreductase [Rhodovulum marinum]|uniref:3-phenylpropionate/trans-cinnamate dioxygenase ferredoxin reductase subunit n=1 Tax=Rhodovulum marinum TaxID=320662 RepID=A0A4R2PV95_9RHOB|nr:FAD-dependent oxidoreductase [Rhodovulum marinum]TCP39992.1 3-phenylpropionate/trans-cinnamate dioxygenase ferredoxin reductase subunit [Rhodovulum marinum]